VSLYSFPLNLTANENGDIVFLSDNANKQTFTYGELFTLTSVIAQKSYEGVGAVLGVVG
jgi:hypothetical protein